MADPSVTDDMVTRAETVLASGITEPLGWDLIRRALEAAAPESSAVVDAGTVDRWTRHLWHTSQHNRMAIGLGGRIQQVVNEMREEAGLTAFGWNTAFLDAEFGECTVHVTDCPGQEHHPEGL